MLTLKKINNNSIYKLIVRLVIIFFSICFIADLYYSSFDKYIMQHNHSKMESINSYSAEFVVDYVAISRSYNDVIDTLNQVQQLADSICSGLNKDYDKVKAIHNYVSETLSYDHVSAEESANLETISLKHILEDKKTICGGFSNLFSALCCAENIYCVNIRGTSKDDSIQDLSANDTPTNHEWNAVLIDNQWIYVDCTWDCKNHYYTNEFLYQKHTNRYFNMSERKMSLSHKIKIVDYRNFFDVTTFFGGN